MLVTSDNVGMYVGQSDKMIGRRNSFSLNMAGIAIENSTNSWVCENAVIDNIGGILFDLSNLSREGTRVRIYNNALRGATVRSAGRSGS